MQIRGLTADKAAEIVQHFPTPHTLLQQLDAS